MPTEESRIESQTENTEEISNERGEELRSQGNENEHETHQLDPTSREETIAATRGTSERTTKATAKINQHSLQFLQEKVLSTWHDR